MLKTYVLNVVKIKNYKLLLSWKCYYVTDCILLITINKISNTNI